MMLGFDEPYKRKTLRGAKKEGEFFLVSFLSHLPKKVGQIVVVAGIIDFLTIAILMILSITYPALILLLFSVLVFVGISIAYSEINGETHPGEAGVKMIETLLPQGKKEEDFTSEVMRL